MPDFNIVIMPSAQNDMQEIFDFIAKDNLSKANEMLNLFERKIQSLACFPKIGYRKSIFVERDIREYVVAKHYQIIYHIKNNTIYVLRVLTGYENFFNIF